MDIPFLLYSWNGNHEGGHDGRFLFFIPENESHDERKPFLKTKGMFPWSNNPQEPFPLLPRAISTIFMFIRFHLNVWVKCPRFLCPQVKHALTDGEKCRMDLIVPVVQGTHANELKMGAGHYAGSSLPGQGRNVRGKRFFCLFSRRGRTKKEGKYSN